MSENYKAPALDKGLSILECLADAPVPMSITHMAREIGLTSSSIYRMVLVLEQRGYIERGFDDRFSLSNHLFDLAMRNPARRNLHDVALPVMHRLADTLKQSCHMAVLSGCDIVVVARVESPSLSGFAVRTGYRRPILQSNSGLVLLACQSVARRKAIKKELLDASIEPAGDAMLERTIAAIVEDGHVVGQSPAVNNITDIAVPIFAGNDQNAIACLTVPFLFEAKLHVPLKTSIDFVRSAAREIGRALEAA